MKAWKPLLGVILPLVLAGPLAAQSGFSCLKPPTISPTLPVDTPITSQDNFNCFGWQEFIALNWKASPAQAGQPDPSAGPSTFGEPSANGDSPAVVWQSYIADTQVFLPNGAPPGPFGAPAGLPSVCTEGKAAASKTKLLAPKKAKDRFSTGYRVLQSTSKFTPKLVTKLLRSSNLRSSQAKGDDLSEIIQAGTHSWLTAQNQEITFYEVRLNEDEYNYINVNKLYNANCQWQAVQPGGPGVLLPAGATQYGQVGAIEVKAAWLPLKDPSLYSQYLTSQAVIVNPDGSCESAVVGLVGLHIIHKTPNAQQFAWATFEHVKNVPDASQAAAGGATGYTYYNANCNPATDPCKCAVNTQPPPCGTASTPPCNYAAPMQVVRSNPLPNYVTSLNAYVQGLIRKENPNSVFLNYQLVNVMWPSRNTTIPPGSPRPLTDGNAQPPLTQGGLANTTMETYFQTTKTCLTCHTAAPISSNTSQGSTSFASDYSFLFLLAESPANPPSNECAPGSTARTRTGKKGKGR